MRPCSGSETTRACCRVSCPSCGRAACLPFRCRAISTSTATCCSRRRSGDPRWSAELKDVRDWWNVLNPEAYFDLLQPGASSVDLWETRYFHVIEGKDPVFHWMMGTGLETVCRGAQEPAEGRVSGALSRTFGRCLSAPAGRTDHSPLSSPLLRGFRLDIVVWVTRPSKSGDPPWRWSSRLLNQRGVRGRPLLPSTWPVRWAGGKPLTRTCASASLSSISTRSKA